MFLFKTTISNYFWQVFFLLFLSQQCIASFHVINDHTYENDSALSAFVKAQISVTPNLDKGKATYQACILCHTKDGSRLDGFFYALPGTYPKLQIHNKEQLFTRFYKRVLSEDQYPSLIPREMRLPVSDSNGAFNPQKLANVVSYIASIDQSKDIEYTNKGSGLDLVNGEYIYTQRCVFCHGIKGVSPQASAIDTYSFPIPNIGSQHYRFLLRQLKWIKTGRRKLPKNLTKMKLILQDLTYKDLEAVSDYVSRLDCLNCEKSSR